MSMLLGRKDQRESVLHCDVEETEQTVGIQDMISISISREKRRVYYLQECVQVVNNICPQVVQCVLEILGTGEGNETYSQQLDNSLVLIFCADTYT